MQEASLKYQCPSVRVVIFNLQSIVKVYFWFWFSLSVDFTKKLFFQNSN